jgi:hypothetical protein
MDLPSCVPIEKRIVKIRPRRQTSRGGNPFLEGKALVQETGIPQEAGFNARNRPKITGTSRRYHAFTLVINDCEEVLRVLEPGRYQPIGAWKIRGVDESIFVHNGIMLATATFIAQRPGYGQPRRVMRTDSRFLRRVVGGRLRCREH